MGDLSLSDIAAATNGRNYGWDNDGNGIIWLFAIMIMLGMMGNWNGNNNAATQEAMTAGFNNQTTQSQLQQIALSSANNNYETAQLINNQTNAWMQQNNTNQINLLQSYNQLQQAITQQGANLQQQINELGYHMDQCCCEIKTQMLQDRLDDANATIVSQNGQISNADQTQTILNTMGRWVGWNTSGSQATTAA